MLFCVLYYYNLLLNLFVFVGVLNFVNPMRPEGSHSLDLSLWDQRQLAKMYALLEVTEPGENWTNKQFRWIIDQAPIPSWQLTKMWMTEEGMPARGIVDLTYYSGEGVGKGGCQSCIPYRKSLLFMVSGCLFVCLSLVQWFDGLMRIVCLIIYLMIVCAGWR